VTDVQNTQDGAEAAGNKQQPPEKHAADQAAAVRIDPHRITAVVFDMDGVVTQTAVVHEAAWKKLFDTFLEARAQRSGDSFQPFTDEDYRLYVDGMPRYDGVTKFLASRGISLPLGTPDDAPGDDTACALGNRKNGYFQQEVDEHGVQPYVSSVDLIRHLKASGVHTAIISASRNATMILQAAGVHNLFETQVDGNVAAELKLPGKPDPAVFLEAARRLGVSPDRAAVVEDAIAGVTAGHRGGFSLVIGVDRTGHPQALRENGADVVVSDLSEVSVEPA
jgi:beta-phosphoglucomutase family hydrolase